MSYMDKNTEISIEIARRVAEKGGSTYYVGGYVRDKILGIENKDIDIEVHGVKPAVLEEILDSLGERITIGESFGIYGLKGYDIDVAMPRQEKNRGKGHKDFDVFVDPDIGTKKASERRDFTINALMQDVLTENIIDHWNGLEDLKAHVIRHINNVTFVEDPLRVLRAAQFAARFEYKVADETIELCKSMNLESLAQERIMAELGKALLKANKPSIFFQVLREMDQLTTWFPEVEDLIGVEQNPRYHAEGDVWTHTMMVLDAAVVFARGGKCRNELGFMLSALCHDFGKVVATEFVNGGIHAYGHEVKGIPLVKTFIKRLTSEKDILDYVVNITRLHMKPNSMANMNSHIKKTNQMFDDAIDPEGLICMALSDTYGQILGENSGLKEPGSNGDWLYARLDIYREYMSRPYVMGRDLMEAGLKPGKEFKEYLDFAHKLRLAGVPKNSVLSQILSMARKQENKK